MELNALNQVSLKNSLLFDWSFTSKDKRSFFFSCGNSLFFSDFLPSCPSISLASYFGLVTQPNLIISTVRDQTNLFFFLLDHLLQNVLDPIKFQDSSDSYTQTRSIFGHVFVFKLPSTYWGVKTNGLGDQMFSLKCNQLSVLWHVVKYALDKA